MATSNAVRADDGSGKNIATRTGTEDAVTKHWQRVLISDPTTPTQELAIDASGFAKVINQANSGVDIGDVTINNAAGASAINIQDGGNSITVDGTVTATLSGSINNTGFNVTPGTSGGCSIYHVVSAGSANAANIKASAGQVFGWNIFNNAAYPVYVKFHNTAGTPTAGAGVVHTIGIQAGTGRDFSSTVGMAFGTGIGITIVKDLADAGSTAVVASDCAVEVYWK